MARKATVENLSSALSLSVQQLLHEFLLTSDVGLAIYDQQLRYRAANPGFAETVGIPAELILGKHVREVLGAVAFPVERALKDAFTRGRPVLNVEIEGVRPGKAERKRWVRNFFPLKDANGRVKQVAVVVVEFAAEANSQPAANVDVRFAGLWDKEVLRSWKEIAKYLGTCVKTVQRWEQAYDLPVRRLAESKGAVVFALKAEIDNWMWTRRRAAKPDADASQTSPDTN
jgi:hypothetical protein